MIGQAFARELAHTWPDQPRRAGAVDGARRARWTVAVLLLAVCLGVAAMINGLPRASVLETANAGPTVQQTHGPAPLSLSTTYEGPTSCANPGFLTGDTIGPANPAEVYAALCGAP